MSEETGDAWERRAREQGKAWLRLTYPQRLAWLEQAKQFAHLAMQVAAARREERDKERARDTLAKAPRNPAPRSCKFVGKLRQMFCSDFARFPGLWKARLAATSC